MRGDMFNSPGLPIKYEAQPGQTFGVDATQNAKPFDSIVAHHTGSPTLSSALNSARKGDPFSGSKYGYHFYIDTDGTVVQGAPLDARTNHVQPPNSPQRTARPDIGNSNSVGISFVGGDSSNPTPEQLAAAQNLSNSLMGRYGIQPENVVGHGQIQSSRQASEGMPLVNAVRNGPAIAAAPQWQGPQQTDDPWAEFVTAAPAKSADDPWAEFVSKGKPKEQQPSLLARAISPITNYPETYNRMNTESRQQIGAGVEQLAGGAAPFDPVKDAYPPDSTAWRLAKGAGNVALGSIGYVASPLNAAIQSVVSKPVEDVTGIPKEYTDFAAGFMVPVPGANMARLKSSPIMTNRTLSAGEQVTQAGENLGNVGTSGGVSIPKAVASDSMSAQRAGSAVANVPIAGNPLVRSAGDTTKRLAEKSQEIAGEYGSASSITAGDTAATAIKDWIGPQSKAQIKTAYDRVDNLVNPSVKTDLSDTRAAAQAILDRRANANITDKSEAVRRIEEAVTNPSGMNYQGIKDLRTYIGELVENKHLLPADIRASELKQIYSGLSTDLRTSVLQAGGQPALSAFERANKYNALVSGRREGLAKIVGSTGEASSAQVFDRLVGMAGNTTRADMLKLAQARKAMGSDAWNEVASGVISQMGRTVDATGNVIFSPQRFLTSYTDKLSAPGRSMLFRSGGKENIAPFLDDIATISGRFRELQKFSNPSGSGQAVAGFGGMAGMALDPLTTVGAGIGINILARALAAPATVAPVAQWTKKYALVIQSPSPANVAQLTIASRNLANSVNSEFGTSIPWQDLIKATQGSVKSRADDENPNPVGVVNR